MKRRDFFKIFAVSSVTPMLAKNRPEPKLETFDKNAMFQSVSIPLCDGDTFTITNGETTSTYHYSQSHWNQSGNLVFDKGVHITL